ncbi:MAG: hypothetical protein HY343_13145 [Lentisphaerae bacterium]|nr:hypothetical protein [Lentisphaerota bacterium]
MKLNPTVTARGLVKLWNYFSHHFIASPGMAHPMPSCFSEAYAVMGAARTMDLLDDAHQTAICRRFNVRMMQFQGVHWPDMFDMGYGYDRDAQGVVNCSCVADNASTANGMLTTVSRFPHLPENPQALASVRRYIDYCLEHFLTDKGVMGVGVLGHQVNPENMREYWCANSLFAATLIRYATVSGDARYYDLAVPLVEFIATYDYKHTLWNEWTRCAPQQIILYTSEGLVPALASPGMTSRLSVPLRNVIQFTPKTEPEKRVPAQAPNLMHTGFASGVAAGGDTIRARTVARFSEFMEWLHYNQRAEGCFEHPASAHYRCYEPGLTWILLEAAETLEGFAWLETIAARQLRFMSTDAGKLYYGLYANDFASSLALLAFATAGAWLKKRDPAAWETALENVFERGEDIW